jgi:hypothetical protein
MSTNLVVQTGPLAQVRDISFSRADLTDNNRAYLDGVKAVENSVLLNLARGVTSDKVSVSLNNKTFDGASLTKNTNFNEHVEINNTIMDTPNFAMSTYLVDINFQPQDASANIGNIVNKTLGTDVNSSVYRAERLRFDISDNTDVSFNTDASNAWFVSFDKTDIDNYYLSKAVNSELNANDADGKNVYPITVVEPSFNSTTALGSLGTTVAFNYYFDFDGKDEPEPKPLLVKDKRGNDVSNNYMNIDGNPSNDKPMFKVKDNKNGGAAGNGVTPLFLDDIGTWRINTLDPSASILTTSKFVSSNGTTVYDVSGSSQYLPFEYVDNKFIKSSDMPDNPAISLDELNLPSVSQFNKLFPGIAVIDDFTFNVTVNAGSGGYFVDKDVDSTSNYTGYNAIGNAPRTGVTDHVAGVSDVSNSLFTIDSTKLINNTLYMRNNYQKKNHATDISNGNLTVTSGDPTLSGNADLFTKDISSGPEKLNADQYSNNGLITLKVAGINDRATVINSDINVGSDDPVGTYVCNDVTDSDLLSDVIYDLSWGDISSNPLRDILRRNQRVDISATVLLGGAYDTETIDFAPVRAYDLYLYDTSYAFTSDLWVDNQLYDNNLDDYFLMPFTYNDSDQRSIMYVNIPQHFADPYLYDLGDEDGFGSDNNYLADWINYDASGLTGLHGQDALHLKVSNKLNLAQDPSGLWSLTGLVDNNPITFGGYPVYDAGYNTPFVEPKVLISNSKLSGLKYNQLRVLLVSKTLSDLSNNDGLRLSNYPNMFGGSLVDSPVFVTGYHTGTPGSYSFTDTTRVDNTFLTQSYNNIKDKLISGSSNKNDEGPLHYGLSTDNLQNFNNDTIITYNCTYENLGRENPAVKMKISDDSSKYLNDDYFKELIVDTIDTAETGIETEKVEYFFPPIGSFTNLYVQLPAIDVAENNYTFNLSFKVSALYGFKGHLQGADYGPDFDTYNFSSDEQGNYWTDISLNKTSSYIDVEAFTDNQNKIVSTIFDSCGNVLFGNMTIGLPKNKNVTNTQALELINPRYSIALVSELKSDDISVVGRQYSISDISGHISDFIGFNPARSDVVKTCGTELKFDLSLSSVVWEEGSTNTVYNQRLLLTTPGTRDISGISIIVQFPNDLITDFSIWFCPQNIYKVDIRTSGEYPDQVPSYAVKSGDSTNTHAILTPGVILNNTFLAPGTGCAITLNPDKVAVNMVSSNPFSSLGDYYDVDPEEPVDISGSLTAGNSLFTRQITLPWYRGYYSRQLLMDVEDTQKYTIKRTPATAHLSIYDASGTNKYFKKLQTAKLGRFDEQIFVDNNLNEDGDLVNSVDLNLVSTDLPYNLGPLGLNVNFQQSMLKSSVTGIRFPISVVGDNFTITTNRVDFSSNNVNPKSITNVYSTDVDNVNLVRDISDGIMFTFPASGSSALNEPVLDSSHCIVAGRVTAGGYGVRLITVRDESGDYNIDFSANFSNTTPSYNLQKLDTALEITYDPSYIGNPLHFVFDDPVTRSPAIIVKNRDLSGTGLQLTPNIKLLNNYAIGRDTNNTQPTYLVSFPPVYKFSAYGANSSNELPFQGGNSLFGYACVDNLAANVKYNPFLATIADNNADLNNMTFTRNDATTYNNLVNTLSPQRNVSVKGNKLNLTEYVSDITRPLYSGFIQDISSSYILGSKVTPTVRRLTAGDVSDNSQEYKFSYNQFTGDLLTPKNPDLNYNIGPNINAYINNAFFAPGVYDISINPTVNTRVELMSVKTTTANNGDFVLDAYKYVDKTSTDYMGQLKNKLTHIGFVASEHWHKTIIIPDISFNGTPFSLSKVLGDISLNDVSGAWQQVDDIDSDSPVVLPFNLVALSNPTGVENIFKCVTVNTVGSNLTVEYFTLPDIINAVSSDGSSVYRVTYNGVVAAPAVSTSSVILHNSFNNTVPNTAGNGGNYVTTDPSKNEFSYFNIGSGETTFR